MLLTAIGILLLALTILDALLTILDASGRSLYSTKVYRLFWWISRHMAKLLPHAVAQSALSLAAPLMIGLHQGLSQYPIVYFYRPRAQERSLPRTIHVLGTLADTLTYRHPGLAKQLPDLQALKAGMQDLVRDLGDAYVPVRDVEQAPPVSFTEFEGAFSGNDWAASEAVRRFLSNCRCLGRIVESSVEPADAYRNYLAWLPADRQMQAFVAGASEI